MMSNKNGDIDDDEIRIISSGAGKETHKKKKALIIRLCCIAAVLAIGCIAVVFAPSGDPVEENTILPANPTQTSDDSTPTNDSVPTASPYVERADTLVNGIKLIILTPHHATPTLEIGSKTVEDSTAVLMAQAADVRGDNGKIVGSFVVRGELASKGEAKAGFCSIANGAISIGVADATPTFEQALIYDGYFFRQYPLVVAGQIIENKTKGRSIRKALAEIDGRISVVVSGNNASYHDFSRALADAGFRNAISLVGGASYGRYTDSAGDTFVFGTVWDKKIENVNYIVWR